MNRETLIADLQRHISDAVGPFISHTAFSILDFPSHSNVGDSAIWLGELEYFKKAAGKYPAYTCTYNDFSNTALDKYAPDGPIFIHGGGNFGDIWDNHHNFREHILREYRHRTVVQLPQSIQFWSDDRRDRTARLIGAHRNFILMVRDEFSLEFARRHFDCQVSLVPDMAFCLGALHPTRSKGDILALMRTDSEASADGVVRPDGARVEDWLDENLTAIRIAKVMGIARSMAGFRFVNYAEPMLTAGARHRLARGLAQLSSARAIITDRLHAHILSLLLGRPHAVLDNNYGKIRRFMDAWSGKTDVSYVATDFDDALRWAEQVPQ